MHPLPTRAAAQVAVVAGVDRGDMLLRVAQVRGWAGHAGVRQGVSGAVWRGASRPAAAELAHPACLFIHPTLPTTHPPTHPLPLTCSPRCARCATSRRRSAATSATACPWSSCAPWSTTTCAATTRACSLRRPWRSSLRRACRVRGWVLPGPSAGVAWRGLKRGRRGGLVAPKKPAFGVPRSTHRPLSSPLPTPRHPRPPSPSTPLPLPGLLDVEPACRGFLELAKEGVAACVAAVFSDPAFADLFPRLYCRRAPLAGCLAGREAEPLLGCPECRSGCVWLPAPCPADYLPVGLPHPRLHPAPCAPAQRRVAGRHADRQRDGHPGGLSGRL